MNIGDIGSALRSVYQLEDSLIPINCISPDPNQHSLSQHITALPPSDSQGPLKWFNTDPQFWGEEEILEWLSYYITKNKWDASFICLAPSHASGKQLCEMSFERFIGTFGYLGEDLYRSLRELRKKYEFEFQLPNGLENTESPFPPTEEEYTGPPFPFPCHPVGQMESMTFNHHLKQFSNSNPDLMKESSFKNIAKLKRRKRERPRKQWSESNDVLKTIKSKCSKCPDTGPHGTHLWEFILNILQNPDRNPGLLKWEDRTEGTFRFLRSDAVAQLWGQKKNNSSMTYEKLSRAMRYYYKKGILERVDGRQLVYKFGTNAKGWKRME
ncbi:ETS homologous factor-like isoform X1 [Heterodontus francisci]|uniref:ETS homologous factor-like isoform X1 n=1 Tax=Heterodontus francisci TaxID=7792 RepID=UPI00355BE360